MFDVESKTEKNNCFSVDILPYLVIVSTSFVLKKKTSS